MLSLVVGSLFSFTLHVTCLRRYTSPPSGFVFLCLHSFMALAYWSSVLKKYNAITRWHLERMSWIPLELINTVIQLHYHKIFTKVDVPNLVTYVIFECYVVRCGRCGFKTNTIKTHVQRYWTIFSKFDNRHRLNIPHDWGIHMTI